MGDVPNSMLDKIDPEGRASPVEEEKFVPIDVRRRWVCAAAVMELEEGGEE